jgi:hypothetical protein
MKYRNVRFGAEIPVEPTNKILGITSSGMFGMGNSQPKSGECF